MHKSDKRLARGWTFALFAITCLLFGGRAALAMPRPLVLDTAGFFKSEAVNHANDVIHSIKQRYGKDVMIETYTGVPEELRADFDRKGKVRFFEEWSEHRFRNLGVDGLYILITKSPGRLQVTVGNNTQRKLFTVADREELNKLMSTAFRERRFDEGLTEGIDFVEKRLERNTGGVGVNRPPVLPLSGGMPATAPSTPPPATLPPTNPPTTLPPVGTLPSPATLPAAAPTTMPESPATAAAETRPTTDPAGTIPTPPKAATGADLPRGAQGETQRPTPAPGDSDKGGGADFAPDTGPQPATPPPPGAPNTPGATAAPTNGLTLGAAA